MRMRDYCGCLAAILCVAFYFYTAMTVVEEHSVSNYPLVIGFLCLAWFVEPVIRLRWKLYTALMRGLESINPSTDEVLFVDWRIPRIYGVVLIVASMLLLLSEYSIASTLVISYIDSPFVMRLFIAGLNTVAEMAVLLVFVVMLDAGVEVIWPGFVRPPKPRSNNSE